MSQTERLYRIKHWLDAGRCASRQFLLDELGISPATLKRDIAYLRDMGRKHTVPYGLYVAHGFVSAFLAKNPPQGTGFSEDDLDLLWQSLEHMFEHDRSAARGEMPTRGLYVFKHENELGNAHAHDLFKGITATKKADVPRDFDDYEVTVNESGLPGTVKLQRKVG